MNPDFNGSCSRSGGYLRDIPTPHIRKFGDHSPLKRRVILRVTSWVGTSAINAKHVYARLEVEHNPIWNSADKSWQTAWDDKGFEWGNADSRFKLQFECLYKQGYEKKITSWVKKTFTKLFDEKQFELVDDNWEPIQRSQWQYKDGD